MLAESIGFRMRVRSVTYEINKEDDFFISRDDFFGIKNGCVHGYYSPTQG